MVKFLKAWHSRETKYFWKNLVENFINASFALKLFNHLTRVKLCLLWKSTFRRFRSKIQAIVNFSDLHWLTVLWHEFLTNLDTKGIKRRLDKWAWIFHKVFVKNTSFYINTKPSKFRPLHTLDDYFWLELYITITIILLPLKY